MMRLGGNDCFNFSTFSESFKTRVYKCLWHRTLNLVWALFLFRFMRAEEASLRLQISMNCLISEVSRGIFYSVSIFGENASVEIFVIVQADGVILEFGV